MATNETSFEQLLSRTALAPSSDTITVVGALARSPDPQKFVLGVQDGQTFTIDVAAVRKFKVVAESVGQILVELELDKAKLPAELRKTVATASIEYKPPVRDAIPTAAENITAVETASETILQHDHPLGSFAAWWDVGPGFGGGSFVGPVPFVAAAAHQAPAETIEAMQNLSAQREIFKFRFDPLPKVRLDPGQTYLPGYDFPKTMPDDR
ncbi:MAG: hypothetical protein ABSC71_06420 [Candidatus Acidiferrales bacterium]|jgi:hypothetical protein